MAQKKKKSASRADREVTSVKKKSAAKKSAADKKKQAREEVRDDSVITHNGMVALSCLGLFILYMVVAIRPEGKLLLVIRSIIYGLIGQLGFYISIPALLYLSWIHTFGKKKSLRFRTFSVFCFIIFMGCFQQFFVSSSDYGTGFAFVKNIYEAAAINKSAGLLCGGLYTVFEWGLGQLGSLVCLMILTVLALMHSYQITIPALIKAYQNRPREERWDDEEEEENVPYVEPAAAVVNHIANRQIEHKRQRRQRMEERAQIQAQQAALAEQQDSEKHSSPENARSVMDTVDQNITAPLDTSDEPVFRPEKKSLRKRRPIVPEEGPKEIFDDSSESDLDLEPPAFVMEQAPAEPAEPVMVRKSEQEASPDMEQKSNSLLEESAEKISGNANDNVEYCFPPIDLLKRPVRCGVDGTDEMRENSQRLNETLASFHIDAHIINVTRGPSVTRYEVELDKGVRLNKLTSCADDIALSLGASGVRIAAVPGKISIVGIEVPNRAVTMVSLREVIDSPEFAKAKSKSSFAVGKDIGGSCIVGNIAKMPHLLIAGTTGSGKSVCMNSIILSLLYKAGPEDVKLIMEDPKMDELGIYNGIPHLLIPVVTDPKKAAGSLQWAVTEMMRRYKMMSDAGVRDLESYNSIMKADEDGRTLPQVVVIIDELADLMLVAAKEVEDSICRIAQMGRAAGMHLVIATQRPSADVITGLMKANIPSRIAFSVSSAMESRIILDTVGAEKLVGKGDMLFSPIGIGKPLRVQGCFVADSEVESVASYVKDHYVASYDQEVLEEIEKKALQTGKKSSASTGDFAPNQEELDGDEMLPAAVDVIMETGQASVSMLQRRLKLGYARAARIVDEMEEKGIVGPFQGSKPRSILITKEQWEATKNGGQMNFDDYENEEVPEELD